jgi:hypothetical protein
MKNLLVPTFLFIFSFCTLAQEQNPCFSVADYQALLQESNPPISYQLVAGWNMVGYTGTVDNNGIVTQLNQSLTNNATAANTFQVIKDVSGQFWSAAFAQISNFTPGEGYMMYVIAETPPIVQFAKPIIFPVLEGCMEPTANNYNEQAVIADYCQYLGCMDAMAGNYNPQANENDGTCTVAEACPYDIYVEYSADAQSYNANLCQTLIVLGCTNVVAENYNNLANTEDNTCIYILGCTDFNAGNYNSEATQDDATCIYYGCMEILADNYNVQANAEDSSCIYYGCMNPSANNYSETANTEDNTCIIYGCTLAAFPNYNSEATTDDFSCDINSTDVFGCTDANYIEYNANVTQNNGTCSILVVFGCLDGTACNYSILANTDDESCEYATEGFDCEGNSFQVLEIGALMHGGIVFYIDETGEHGLVAAMEDLGSYQWGCYGTDLNGDNSSVSPELDGIGFGYENSLEIVSGCSVTPIAASEALNASIAGYTDWYLPSRFELVEMYNTIGNGGLQGNIGGFQNDIYWSSSEYNFDGTWTVIFSSGYTNYNYKYNSFRVRAVRAF